MSAVELEDTTRDSSRLILTGQARTFPDTQIIVSKTDTRGVMTYVNQLFLDISGYTENEMLGRPHNVIRHPHMPRCVFKLLWETIKQKQEIFAYVMNRCKNGDHYWVLAHVTPTFDEQGQLTGYHSSRRAPKATALQAVEPLYRQLVQIERQQGGQAGLEKATEALHETARKGGMAYDQFVLSL